jgi:hypothetical protein
VDDEETQYNPDSGVHALPEVDVPQMHVPVFAAEPSVFVHVFLHDPPPTVEKQIKPEPAVQYTLPHLHGLATFIAVPSVFTQSKAAMHTQFNVDEQEEVLAIVLMYKSLVVGLNIQPVGKLADVVDNDDVSLKSIDVAAASQASPLSIRPLPLTSVQTSDPDKGIAIG